jgi:hypothetical protein
VRFLGTFLADPAEVPRGVVGYLAGQLGIADTGGLERYAAGEMRRDHVAEIRRHYGYRDFHEGAEAAALRRWLANRAWVSAERPTVLFDLATARLVERKVLLPGEVGHDALRDIGGVGQEGAQEPHRAELHGEAEAGVIVPAPGDEAAVGVVEVEVAPELRGRRLARVAAVAQVLARLLRKYTLRRPGPLTS